jgi:hypothetical protein
MLAGSVAEKNASEYSLLSGFGGSICGRTPARFARVRKVNLYSESACGQ